MLRAVVLALGDPRSSDAGTWVDAVAWLRQELAQLDFQVTVIDGDHVETDLRRALEGLKPEDDLFCHLSGRLAERGVLRTSGGHRIRLQTLGDALAGATVASMTVFAELLHEDDPDDPLVSAEHVSWITDAFGPGSRTHAIVAGVRPAVAPVEGLALTRLFIDTARDEGHSPFVTSSVYERVAALEESSLCAQSFTFVGGATGREVLSSRPRWLPPTLERMPSVDEPDPNALTPPVSGNFRASERSPTDVDGTQWQRVVQLRRERLQTIDDGRARIRELVGIARILQAELGDAQGAIEALEEARGIDPTRVAVLQALARGYERLGLWEQARGTLEALASLSTAPADRAEHCYALARLCLDQMGDLPRAETLLEEALRLDPDHERARATLEELRSRQPASAVVPAISSPDEISVELAFGPPIEGDGRAADGGGEVASFARAFEQHRQEGSLDAALLDAMALEEMGACGGEAQALVTQLRTVTPLRARGTLDAAAWELLRAPGSNEALAALFAAVARVAISTRLEQLAAKKRLVTLDPQARLEQSSTASVVRSFQWAARVLTVTCPALYVVDPVPGDIAAVRAQEPSTALGPAVLRGRSAKDLAFLAGRHLTYYRPEHQVLVYFPSNEDLSRLLGAALGLGAGARPGSDTERSAVALQARLAERTTGAEKAAIAAAAERLDPSPDLWAWARSVELTAARAGLTLCGDLANASAITRGEERGIAGLTTEEKLRDLVAFCASTEHLALRTRLAGPASEGAASAFAAMHAHSP